MGSASPSSTNQAAPRSTMWKWDSGWRKLMLQGAENSVAQTISPRIRTSARTSDMASGMPSILGMGTPGGAAWTLYQE